MNKFVKDLLETYAHTLAFNPALLGGGPRKKTGQSVASNAYSTYQPKTEKELKEILREHINHRNFDFSDISLYFLPNDVSLFNNKILNEVDLEELKEYCFEYRPKTNKELLSLMEKFKYNGDLNFIDVSLIEDFSEAFKNRYLKNVDISCWDVSKGKKFNGMFKNSSEFHGDISNWDMRNAVSLREMFYKHRSLQIDVSKWDVSNCEDFARMFSECNSFTSDLSRWNVSKGKNFYEMFNGCSEFDCDLSKWDVSNALSMSHMFMSCYKLIHSDFSKWNVSKVKSFNAMFCHCNDLDVDLSRWDVSSGKDFSWMFTHCKKLNFDISKWDVSNGLNFEGMLCNCGSMNVDIRHWNMTNAINVSKFVDDSPGIITYIEPTNDTLYKPATKEYLKEIINDYISWECYDLNDIDVSLITDFSYLFNDLYYMEILEKNFLEDPYREHSDDEEFRADFLLDISKWDLSNGENFSHMFDGAYYIDFEAEGFKNLNVSNGKDFSYMFANIQDYDNPPLKFDLSGWNVSNGEDFSYMFYKVWSGFNFDFGEWDVSSGKDFSYMFYDTKLAYIIATQVDNWKIKEGADLTKMFGQHFSSTLFKKYPIWYDVEENEK